MSTATKLSWVPEARGRIYCAPACGRGCTWKEYLTAKKLAHTTARVLGKGWKGVVFENLGWFVQIDGPVHGMEMRVECDKGRPRSYDIALDLGDYMISASARTPRAAVRKLRILIRADAARMLEAAKRLDRIGNRRTS